MKRLCLALAFLATSIAGACAQPYPNRPIKLIVPFEVGGTIDAVARLVAQGLSSRVGQNVIVENRPGAGATIGLKAALGASPDGYTLLVGSSGSLAINPALYKKLDFTAAKTLVPIAALVTIPNVLGIATSLPATSVAEFVAYSKANPGKVSFGASLGSPPHLMGEYFRIKSGADMSYVPYKGSANAMTDLLGGRLQALTESPATSLPLIHQGKVRPLVVTSEARLPELPDVPTLVEVGIHGYPAQTWMGMVAPPGTSSEIVSKLNAVVNNVLNGADTQASLAKLGFTPKVGSAQNFATFIASEVKNWAAVVETIGTQAD
jgi:tripartite-type tricarboxylate transporter receptor subunit TctC